MEMDNVIELHDVDIFMKDVLVLNKISLKVRKGEFVYLIGKTASGKSSLLKAIYAEAPLKQGEAVVVGFNLRKLKNRDIPQLRRKLGIVFQDFQLLTDRTVFENLQFVLKATGWKNKRQIAERIQDVLNKVDLGTKGHKMPHQLSGGEQQRVAIARALLNDPEIIIADEPTGNLDPETSRGIMKLLFEIKQTGRAVLMATHNYSLFQEFPSRTLKCEEGQLVESEHELN
jgi:cell division transport system ATP-binding protein